MLIYDAAFTGAGLLFYGFAFFISHVFRGESFAPGFALGLITAFYILTRMPLLERLNVFDLMSGKPIIEPDSSSWISIAVCLAGFAGFVWASTLVAAKREF